MTSIDQLDQFLSENPDIEIFEVLLHDLNGAQRGKWLPRDKIHKLFKGVPRMFEAGRYHSWAVRAASLPAGIQVIAVDEQEEIMAIRVSDTDIYGIQFHPESILTPEGKTILNNFLIICKNKAYANAIGKAV